MWNILNYSLILNLEHWFTIFIIKLYWPYAHKWDAWMIAFVKVQQHICTVAWCNILTSWFEAWTTALTIFAYQWWHETSVGFPGSFHQQSIKQPEFVSNWNLYAPELEWFMHLSFLICWNKVSTFLFHCTSQARKVEEISMEQMSLKKIAKSTWQFVDAQVFPCETAL